MNPMNWPSRKTWFLTASLALTLAATAVAVVAFLSYKIALGPLVRIAEQIASPGELLWWSTLGGVFAGRPVGASGVAMWLLGTAVFWFVVAAVVLLFWAWIRHRWHP